MDTQKQDPSEEEVASSVTGLKSCLAVKNNNQLYYTILKFNCSCIQDIFKWKKARSIGSKLSSSFEESRKRFKTMSKCLQSTCEGGGERR